MHCTESSALVAVATEWMALDVLNNSALATSAGVSLSLGEGGRARKGRQWLWRRR